MYVTNLLVLFIYEEVPILHTMLSTRDGLGLGFGLWFWSEGQKSKVT